MLLKGLVVAAFICCAYASTLTGPCKDAKQGGKYEKCEMDCGWDGTCFEVVKLETCDCKNAAVITTIQYNFKNGTFTTKSNGRRKKREAVDSELKSCNGMQRRCKNCISKKNNNAPAGKASAWKSKWNSC